MALSPHLVGKPNLAWLESVKPLTREETRQRENQSDVGRVEEHGLDVAFSDDLGEAIWEVLDTPATV